jgi:hypothetical protein
MSKMGFAMRRLLEGYGRKKRRARVKLAARTAADHRSVTILYWGWLGLLLTE